MNRSNIDLRDPQGLEPVHQPFMMGTRPEDPVAFRTFKEGIVISLGQRFKAVQDFLLGSVLEPTVAVHATGERAQTSFQVKEIEDRN